jgi:hypothetical protein
MAEKAKFRVGQVVVLVQAPSCCMKIQTAELHLKGSTGREDWRYWDGGHLYCWEGELRSLTAREIGPRPRARRRKR